MIWIGPGGCQGSPAGLAEVRACTPERVHADASTSWEKDGFPHRGSGSLGSALGQGREKTIDGRAAALAADGRVGWSKETGWTRPITFNLHWNGKARQVSSVT